MKVSGKLGEYWNDPFGFVDQLELTFKGNNFNIFQKYKRVQKTAFCVAMVALGAWMVLGFDSTPLQFIHVLYEGVPNFVLGKASFADLHVIYNNFYGKEMHYSAFVIYGLMFWALSRHFDKNLGITKSKNIAYACSLTFLSVAIFEWFWMLSFATFQRQPWVITPKWPQLRIHLQNFAFSTVGVLGVVYMWADSYVLNDKAEVVKRLYKFRLNKIALFLIGLSVFGALFWWFYPFPVERFAVELETGETWVNSNRFPQTLYTIDLDPTDSVNAGVWFHKGNDLVHLVNTLVKAIWTFTIFYVGRVKSETA